MKRAVIYARVSKDREESVSIEAQIEHCTARAQQLGATVLKVFQDEGISGREARNRSAFQRAKAFCEAANVEYFITWSTSRFARNMLELFISEAELRGVGTTAGMPERRHRRRDGHRPGEQGDQRADGRALLAPDRARHAAIAEEVAGEGFFTGGNTRSGIGA
jgi:hypothetical protein